MQKASAAATQGGTARSGAPAQGDTIRTLEVCGDSISKWELGIAPTRARAVGKRGPTSENLVLRPGGGDSGIEKRGVGRWQILQKNAERGRTIFSSLNIKHVLSSFPKIKTRKKKVESTS